MQGYFDPLLALFERMERERFMQPKYRSMVITDDTPEGILEQFARYVAPPVKTFLTGERT